MSDPQKYRKKSEYDAMKKDDKIDPILRLVRELIDRNLTTQDEIDGFDKDAKKRAIDAQKYAEASPETPSSELYTDIYINPYGPYKVGELPIMLTEETED